ncbi:MAG: ribosomal-protein-alanine N-acetyltransferase [Candidatus Aminicenantes bacterium]|nr:ribosomal-protein-alanine N-acetyltransferase [Candidatus Aminicenantes bacterium]
MEIEKKSFSNPWHLSSFEGEIANDGISFPFVIVHPETRKVMGYIIFWQIGEEIQISNFAVHPDQRRKGMGSSVLGRMLGIMKQRGARIVTLEVRESNNSARALYRRFGFEEAGTRKDYYSRPQEDAVVMLKRMK